MSVKPLRTLFMRALCLMTKDAQMMVGQIEHLKHCSLNLSVLRSKNAQSTVSRTEHSVHCSSELFVWRPRNPRLLSVRLRKLQSMSVRSRNSLFCDGRSFRQWSVAQVQTYIFFTKIFRAQKPFYKMSELAHIYSNEIKAKIGCVLSVY